MTKKEALDIIEPIVKEKIWAVERANCVYEDRIKINERVQKMRDAMEVLGCLRK